MLKLARRLRSGEPHASSTTSWRAVLATIGRRAWLVAVTTITWLSVARLALAAGDEEEAEKKYTLPYILVILVVSISLAVVLKPAGRETEIKLRPYDE